jgi:hypothetical protein
MPNGETAKAHKADNRVKVAAEQKEGLAGALGRRRAEAGGASRVCQVVAGECPPSLFPLNYPRRPIADRLVGDLAQVERVAEEGMAKDVAEERIEARPSGDGSRLCIHPGFPGWKRQLLTF